MSDLCKKCGLPKKICICSNIEDEVKLFVKLKVLLMCSGMSEEMCMKFLETLETFIELKIKQKGFI